MKKKLELVIEGTCAECLHCGADCNEISLWCNHPEMTGKDNYICRMESAFPSILPNCPLPEVETL